MVRREAGGNKPVSAGFPPLSLINHARSAESITSNRTAIRNRKAMDPLTAVSLAGTILQFIDFSSKLVAGTYEIYRSASGATAENEDITTVITDLKEVTLELDADIVGRGKHEKALKALATKCGELSGQLLAVLEKLRASDKQSAWKSLRVKWASMRKSDEIQRIERRLGEYRSEILVRLTLILSDQQSSTRAQLNQIQNDGKRLSSESAVRLSNIQDDILRALEQRATRLPAASEQAQATGLSDMAQSLPPQPDLHQVKADISSLTSLVATMTLENRILENIYFPSMHDREDGIHDAEMGTSEWLLREEESTVDNDGGKTPMGKIQAKLFEEEREKRAAARSSFLTWLRTCNGVYHISGKAGSGKSTLMKILSNHTKTKEQLTAWADDKTLTFARFYFWKAGDSLQQSLQGLYRSLLFEVLRQYPELIPRVFPSQWEQLQASTGTSLADKSLFRPGHIKEAVTRLVQHKEFPRHRFCFFIDGLDEYDGDAVDHTMLATSLRDWASENDVKICVSSRPHLEFHDVFLNSPDRRMHLHELTKHDIYLYSRHMIEKATGSDDISDDYQSLIDMVVRKSDGVFLWAWLVVRTLMSGILRRDPIGTLLDSLEATPKRLHDLYVQLLDSLQPHDQKRGAEMLVLVAYNRHYHPFSSLAFHWLDHLEDANFPSVKEIQPLTQEALNNAVDAVDRQVRSVANGFLESFPYPSDDPDRDISLTSSGLRGYRFFHRTARDFVMNHPRLGEIVDIASVSGLETTHRLRLAELMSLSFELRYPLWEHFHSLFSYTFRYFGEELPITLLEKYHHAFQETAQQLSIDPIIAVCNVEMMYDESSKRKYVQRASEWTHPLASSFPHVAVSNGCGHYTIQLARHNHSLLEGTSELNLLVTAALFDRLEVLKGFLEMGAPLDAQIEFTVPFERDRPDVRPVWMVILSYLAMVMAACYLADQPIDDLHFEMLEVLLLHKSLPECAILVRLQDAVDPILDATHFITLEQITQAASPRNKNELLSSMGHRPSTIRTALNYLRSLSPYSDRKRGSHLLFDGVLQFSRDMFPLAVREKMQIVEIACGQWKMEPRFDIGFC
ncbi:hypothetical protein BJY00DRAFT_266622 [Aspergillus carlsbadensis]|nr:hypothetical protein BJY00DRAFT_266622 [Aspergillus carlsbadensis]